MKIYMKKIIKDVDEKRGIVQVTIADERWYFKPDKSDTGEPIYKAVPSVTWIASKYPKGIAFYKWLADKGWDEAEALKSAAGDKGSKVHFAVGDVLKGVEVRIDSKYTNPSTGQEEELTLEECDAILSFIKWRKDTEEEFDIEVITWESTLFSDQYNYAGTVDFIIKLTDKKTGEVSNWIVDFKTGQYIWPEYELQLSAYKHTIENAENYFAKLDVTNLKMAVLQLGYRRNKNGYKWTEIEDKFDLFLAAKTIWKSEHGDDQPTKKDYPIILSPALVLDEELKEVKPKKK